MSSEAKVENIEARALFRLQNHKRPFVLIDVSTAVEYREVHVRGALNLPIGSSELREWMGTGGGKGDEPCFVMCRGGVRSVKVCEQFADAKLTNVEGGMKRWKEEGFPVSADKKVVSLDRQVRMAAGTLIVFGTALAFLVHPYFMALPAFVGGGLFYAGATDSCGMAMLLTKMPWNRSVDSKSREAVASFSH